MASTTVEIVWITFLLRDIGIPLPIAPQLFCDNKSALYMTVNPIFHARSKHIEIDYHFVREKVAVGALTTRYIPSTHQIADVFTKPLAKLPFHVFRGKLGVHSLVTSILKKGEKVNAPMNHSLTEATDTSSLGNKQIMANILECAVISLGAN